MNLSQAKKYILLVIILIIIGAVFSYAAVHTPKNDVNTKAALQAYASSTNYILMEQEAIIEGEEKQASHVRADQSVISKYKVLFED